MVSWIQWSVILPDNKMFEDIINSYMQYKKNWNAEIAEEHSYDVCFCCYSISLL